MSQNNNNQKLDDQFDFEQFQQDVAETEDTITAFLEGGAVPEQDVALFSLLNQARYDMEQDIPAAPSLQELLPELDWSEDFAGDDALTEYIPVENNLPEFSEESTGSAAKTGEVVSLDKARKRFAGLKLMSTAAASVLVISAGLFFMNLTGPAPQSLTNGYNNASKQLTSFLIGGDSSSSKQSPTDSSEPEKNRSAEPAPSTSSEEPTVSEIAPEEPESTTSAPEPSETPDTPVPMPSGENTEPAVDTGPVTYGLPTAPEEAPVEAEYCATLMESDPDTLSESEQVTLNECLAGS